MTELEKENVKKISAETLAELDRILNTRKSQKPEDMKEKNERDARTKGERGAAHVPTIDKIKIPLAAGVRPYASAPHPTTRMGRMRESFAQRNRTIRALEKDMLLTAGVTGVGVVLGAGAMPSIVTAGAVGGSLAALYGLGRIEEKVWKQEAAGFLRTVGRGILSPVGIPVGIAVYGLGLLKQAGKNELAAAKSIAKGEGTLGHITDPIRWGWHLGTGAVNGFRPSTWERLKDTEKLTSIPGKMITKTWRFIMQ